MNHASHIKVVGVNERGRIVGDGHHRAKLTQDVVNQLRDLHEDEANPVGYRRLARMFGIPVGTVQRICTYERWQTAVEYRRVVVQHKPLSNQARNMYETERVAAPGGGHVEKSGESDD